MSKQRPPALDSDFAEVAGLLKSQHGIDVPPAGTTRGHFRKLHEATYSLVQLRFFTDEMQPNARVFLEELASDAVQGLSHGATGNVKIASLMLRGVVENALRHIYFADHPIEFRKIEQTNKFYVSTEDLVQYIKSHPDLGEPLRSVQALATMETLLDELSQFVHGRSILHLQLKKALLAAPPKPEDVATCARYAAMAAQFAVPAVVLFNLSKYRSLTQGKKATLVFLLDNPTRQLLTGLAYPPKQ